MTGPTFNDNEPSGLRSTPLPEASGQAAISLVESLIHGLIVHSVITVEDAIEIVEVAAEVEEQRAADLGDSPANLWAPLVILKSIRASLKLDHPEG